MLTASQRIAVIISVYIFIILVITWLLGFLLLLPFYETSQVNNVKKQVSIIEKNIDSEELAILARRISNGRNVCIIVSQVGAIDDPIISEHIFGGCEMHSRPTSEYYNLARNNDEKTYQSIVEGQYAGTAYDPDNYEGRVPRSSAKPRDSYVYAKIVKDTSNISYLVVVEGVCSPSMAEVNTLVYHLISLSVLVVIFGILIIRAITKNLIGPVVTLSEASKDIVRGDAEFDVINRPYKEVDDLRQSLDYASKELNKLEKYRRELIANVSHDLKTPLALIKGYSEMMKDIPGEATPENIQVIIDETTRLAGLVNDMLDLSRLQDGGDRLKIKVFDLVKALEEPLKIHGKLLEAKGYKLILEHEDEAFVYADEGKIIQVIYNLLNNAVNYAGADKTVWVRQTTNGLNVRVEVIDNGEGVDVDILPHIWDRYYKSAKSHKRAVVGTGLGLSIVKSVMNMHPGGVYGVNTSVGEGSTFYIELPKLDPRFMDLDKFPEIIED